jgi:ABC-2 type transport system permease protein
MKCVLRDKEMMFWTLLFPIVLATFFNLAFTNLNSHELFHSIPLAIVSDDAFRADPMLEKMVDEVATSDDPLFAVQYVTKQKAEELLVSGEVSGYLEVEDGLHLYFKNSGMNQTMIKSFFDQYLQNTKMVTTIMTANPGAIQGGLLDSLQYQGSPIEDGNASSAAPDNTVVYFYTIIAMACFYGGFMGMKEVNAIQANLSTQAARINVAPTRKMKTFLSSITAATLVQFTSIVLLLGYLVFLLKVDFGSQIGFIFLLCFTGCITGVSFGAMISALSRGGEGIKTGILISTTMVLSFLAGMMFVQVKYVVTAAIPALAYINPVNVITDGFYTLYYYQTYSRFFTNIGILWIFTILFSVITVLRLRRLKYASI